MGKISKALDKAQKQHSAPRKQKPGTPPERLDREGAKPVVDAVRERPMDRRPHDSEAESKGVESIFTSETTTSSGDDENSQPMKNNTHSGKNVVDASQERFRANPAMEKASNDSITLVQPAPDEQPSSPHAVNSVTDDRKRNQQSGRSIGEKEKKRVSVQYSKTKVQIGDPEKLMNNKVLSLFEDIETTNQFKMLRTHVLRKLKAIGGNSLLVTSANPCEGKTFTSINLGISIAKEFDRTVLIIDADIRRPLKEHTDFATEFFSLQVDKGLTDYLEGDADIEDILINPGVDKLTLIPGGVPVDNSPELLNSARMETMMAEIKNRYPSDRLIILDGPAMLHFPDAMILYRYVDGVLPVIESEKTSSDNVKKMMEHLQEVNVLGVVMNKNRG